MTGEGRNNCCEENGLGCDLFLVTSLKLGCWSTSVPWLLGYFLPWCPTAVVPFCRGCSALRSCGLSVLEVVTGNWRVRSLFVTNLSFSHWNYLDLCQLGWPRVKITFSVGSGANDTCFLRDFSPLSSKYCSPTPASSSLPPSHWARGRIPVAGQLSQLLTWGMFITQILSGFAPGACTAETRRSRNTYQFFIEFPFKLPLLFLFHIFLISGSKTFGDREWKNCNIV